MRRFSLSQLDAFLWICRLGTFHAAAERLNLTQPTISLRIRELETAVGAKLFERRGSGMRLSAKGSILLQYAERGFELFDEMEERLRSGDPLQGILRLGVSDTFAMTGLPEMMQRLETDYPRLRVDLTVVNSLALADLLLTKKLDLAILTEPREMQGISIELLGATDVTWVSSTRRPVKQGAPLRPRDLAGENVLSVPAPSPLHSVLTEWYMSEGSPPPSFSTCNNIAVIARLVTAGVAVGILPTCILRREIESGTVMRYDAIPPLAPRSVCAAFATSSRGPGFDALLNIARKAVEHAEMGPRAEDG